VPGEAGERPLHAPRLRGLLLAAAVVTCFDLFLYNLYQYLHYLPGHPEISDFRAFYAAAKVGLGQGWTAIYERDRLEPVLQALWPGSPYVAFLNPPPLAWLLTPLTVLPPTTAFFAWAGIDLAILAACALACAPPRPAPRLAALLSVLGFLPTYSVVTYGTVAPLLLAVVAGCWALLRRDRQVEAGLLLSLLVLKPQVALLVPVALLAAGRLRCFLAWAIATGLLASISLLAIGQAGALAWLQGLRDISQDPFLARYSIADLAGGGLPGWAARAAVASLALLDAWLGRRRGPEVAISAAVPASLLVAGHITPGDFVMLLLPVWLLLRTSPPPPLEMTMLLGCFWLAAWLAPGPALPVVVLSLLLLVALVAYGWDGRRWPLGHMLVPMKHPVEPAAARGGAP
jgi:hypothetical protein